MLPSEKIQKVLQDLPSAYQTEVLDFVEYLKAKADRASFDEECRDRPYFPLYSTMPRTYRAILHGDRVEWIDSPPKGRRATQIRIILLESDADTQEARGRAMAAALEELARAGGVRSIADPVEWQRSTREERPLPEREI